MNTRTVLVVFIMFICLFGILDNTEAQTERGIPVYLSGRVGDRVDVGYRLSEESNHDMMISEGFGVILQDIVLQDGTFSGSVTTDYGNATVYVWDNEVRIYEFPEGWITFEVSGYGTHEIGLEVVSGLEISWSNFTMTLEEPEPSLHGFAYIWFDANQDGQPALYEMETVPITDNEWRSTSAYPGGYSILIQYHVEGFQIQTFPYHIAEVRFDDYLDDFDVGTFGLTKLQRPSIQIQTVNGEDLLEKNTTIGNTYPEASLTLLLHCEDGTGFGQYRDADFGSLDLSLASDESNYFESVILQPMFIWCGVQPKPFVNYDFAFYDASNVYYIWFIAGMYNDPNNPNDGYQMREICDTSDCNYLDVTEDIGFTIVETMYIFNNDIEMSLRSFFSLEKDTIELVDGNSTPIGDVGFVKKNPIRVTHAGGEIFDLSINCGGVIDDHVDYVSPDELIYFIQENFPMLILPLITMITVTMMLGRPKRGRYRRSRRYSDPITFKLPDLGISKWISEFMEGRSKKKKAKLEAEIKPVIFDRESKALGWVQPRVVPATEPIKLEVEEVPPPIVEAKVRGSSYCCAECNANVEQDDIFRHDVTDRLGWICKYCGTYNEIKG